MSQFANATPMPAQVHLMSALSILVICDTSAGRWDILPYFIEYTRAQHKDLVPQHSQKSRRHPSAPTIILPVDGQRDTLRPAGFRGNHRQSHKRPYHPQGGQGGSSPRRCISGEPVTSISSSKSFQKGGQTSTAPVVGIWCLRHPPRLPRN
jgi:hypothetical protein